MNFHIVLGLMCLISSNVHADENCDNNMCLLTCQQVKLNGTCDASGNCQCSFGHSCSTMANTCDIACKILRMEGECDDNDQCQCSATPELCNPMDCQESCQDDPRAADCILVEAVGCIEYGPVTFCECWCIPYQWAELGQTMARQWSTLRKTGAPNRNKIEVLRV